MNRSIVKVSIYESCLSNKHTSKIDIYFPAYGNMVMNKKNEKKWRLEYLESFPQQDSDKQKINLGSK